MPRSELFIGNLVNDLSSKDIEDVFEKYGRILKCELKNKGPGASFCFVEYEDERDAEEALKSENGKDLRGKEIVVEFAKGKRREGGRGGPGGFRDDRRGGAGGPRGGRGGNECYNCGQSGHFARDCRGGGSGRRPGGDRDGGRDFRGGDRDRGSRYGGDRDRRRSRSRSRS